MIIGIVGTIGSGKGMVAEYLTQKGFSHVGISKLLSDEAIKQGRERNRITFRKIANELRKESPTALVARALGVSSQGRLVVESLHTVPEVKYVQEKGFVVAVDAPRASRIERILKRGEPKDALPNEKLLEEELLEMNSPNRNENNLTDAIRAADVHVENSGTPEELYEKIDGILNTFGV